MNKKKRNIVAKKKTIPYEMLFLIISTVIVLPLVYSNKVLDPTLPTRLLGLVLIILFLFALNMIRLKKDKYVFDFTNNYIFLTYLLYLLWSAFTMIFAINPSEGLFDITKLFLVIILLIYTVKVLIVYDNSVLFLTKIVVISAIIATSIGLYQYAKNIPGKSGHELFSSLYEIKGLMAQKNQFSISLFLMLPFTVYGIYITKKYWKGLSIYSTLIILITITIVQTRSVWIATTMFGVIFTILLTYVTIRKRNIKKTKIVRGTVIVIGALIVLFTVSFIIIKKTGALETVEYRILSMFDMNSHDNQGRLNIWESTINLSKDNLLLGVGAGNWKLKIPTYFPYNVDLKYQNWRRPHNDILWVLSEKGGIGLFLYLLIFGLLAYYAIIIFLKEKDINKLILTSLVSSAIVGYLIIAQLTFPLERINHQVYLTIYMAIIICYYHQIPENVKSNNNYLFVKAQPYLIIIIAAALYYSSVFLNSELHLNKLIAYRNAGKWNEVITLSDKAYSKLTTIDAFSSPIHLHKGEANIKLNNTKQANIDLIKALQYAPSNISVLNNLAIVSAQLSDSVKALYYLNKGLEVYPKYEASLFNKANVYLRFKDYKKSYIALLNCSTKEPNKNYDEFMNLLISKID